MFDFLVDIHWKTRRIRHCPSEWDIIKWYLNAIWFILNYASFLEECDQIYQTFGNSFGMRCCRGIIDLICEIIDQYCPFRVFKPFQRIINSFNRSRVTFEAQLKDVLVQICQIQKDVDCLLVYLLVCKIYCV